MAENNTLTEWRIIGETVPGASHIRASIPNQDSILYVRESNRTLPIVLSVADGHGSPKCFRSDRGSRFAVKKGAYLLTEFLDERRGKFDLAEIESQKDYLAKVFVKRWREAVEVDLKKEPFTTEEFENLEKKSDAKAKKLVEDNPFLAYGTTSLNAAFEEDFILYLQLGDGDILNVSASGEVSKPLPEDARLLANETTSMCLPKAEKDFRFFAQKISAEQSPAFVLLSTDGYLNSFSSEAGFFQAATDIQELLRAENGFNAVSENLKGWLEEATRMGSGDDCTVGIVYRPDALKKSEITEILNESEKLKTPETTTKTETPPSTETSAAIAALTNSAATTASENMEDVTVTITIKKDKNKISTPSPTVEENSSETKPATDNSIDKQNK
jgi:serine/threonine protein phosphatase PrpC